MSPTAERLSFFFVIPGRPIPAQRMTRQSKNLSPRAKRSLAYQKLVALAAWSARVPEFVGPVKLTCRFFFADRKHGDLSNCVKAVEDGLQYGGILKNDRQVLRYGEGTGIYYGPEERAEVWIEEVEE